MPALRLLAGPKAFRVLNDQGFNPNVFSQLLAASGGPKWLGIAGLDKYLFGEFFNNLNRPLYTLGASSGAWRIACLAQQQPLEAYKRLEQFYIGQRYDTVPKPYEVSEQVRGVVAGILGETGRSDILNHPHIHSHFVVCRGKHLNRLPGRLPLAAGLALTAGCNLISRKSLPWHFERVVFSRQPHKEQVSRSTHAASPFLQLTDMPSEQATLSTKNVEDVLLATGSIPMVLAPVTHIHGVKPGHYYDGGITDYHFDLPLAHAEGLTLYPHFFPQMSPGWFDKSLSWRNAKAHYDNALVLVPSAEFVASLPFGKIPDRDDFKRLDTATRMAYWREAASRSECLGAELDQLIHSGDWQTRLERL